MKKLLVALTAISSLSFADDLGSNPNIVPNGDGTFSIRKSWLMEQKFAQMTSPLYDQVKQTVRTLPDEEVQLIRPGREENPSNVRRVEAIVTEEIWDYVFPRRADEYTYTGFLKSVGKFPAFCGDYDDGRDAEEVCRKVLATSFSHFAQETGMGCDYTAREENLPRWRQGLYYVREMNWEEGMSGYNSECTEKGWQTEKWPCGRKASGEFQGYFGRGAKQLSYHYNYGPFSEAMFGDASVLLDDPSLVATTWLNLASAIYFYVTPQPPKPSMLHVADGTWQPNEVDREQGIKPGFGATINVINGGVECGHGERAQAVNRVRYYREFAPLFGVEIPEDEELGCADQDNFIVGGAGAMLIQWEDQWAYVAENPHGKSFACQLVGYQTAESALVEGDYISCILRHYGDMIVLIDDLDEVSIVSDGEMGRQNISDGIYVTENPVSEGSNSVSLMVVTNQPATVQIAIFDVTGNIIDRQAQRTDVYESALFSWDLRNSRGARVAPGSYVAFASIRYSDGREERARTVIGVR